jgi:hypothetical protein
LKGQSPTASTIVKRYISAVQSGDRKTIADLSFETQQQVSSIKANNPQILWAKVLKEFYAAQSAASPDPSAEAVEQFLPSAAQWRITEARVDKSDGQNKIRVYVSANYPTLEDSPFIGITYLKKSVLQFNLSSNPSLVLNVVRLTEGDLKWDKVRLMIQNARWFADGISGTHLHLFAIGGKTPFKWSAQCGSSDLFQDFSGVDGFGMTLNPSNQELIIDSGRHLADYQYPLPCSATVKDADGSMDSVKFSIPNLMTGLVSNYCWARAPWSHRGQGLPYLPIGECIGQVIDFKLSKNNQ